MRIGGGMMIVTGLLLLTGAWDSIVQQMQTWSNSFGRDLIDEHDRHRHRHGQDEGPGDRQAAHRGERRRRTRRSRIQLSTAPVDTAVPGSFGGPRARPAPWAG